MNTDFQIRISAALVIMLLLPSVPSSAQCFPFEKCHMQTGKVQQVLGTLDWTITAPNCDVTKWIVFMPQAPVLEAQTAPTSNLFSHEVNQHATTVLEPTSAKRKLMQLLISDSKDKHKLSGIVKYQVLLAPRNLVTGASEKLVPSLGKTEELRYLSQSDHLNFNDAIFQKWLDENALRKNRESDLQFAWRSFMAIRNSYNYNYSVSQDRHVSSLCQGNSTDCGGLSWLFVAVLRANGIPARSLIGRWAKSANAQVGAEEAHVKAEFFAKDIGWIPVEVSGAVNDKSRDPLKYFGREKGNFITFHIDPDILIDTKLFGTKAVRNIQSPAIWFSGSGTSKGTSLHSNWTVF